MGHVLWVARRAWGGLAIHSVETGSQKPPVASNLGCPGVHARPWPATGDFFASLPQQLTQL
jgi:hypothetical protein